MNPRTRIWIIGIALLAGVWALAWGAMRWAGAAQVTATRVIEQLESQPLADLSPEQRMRRVESLATMINRLPFEERRDPRLQQRLRERFVEMSPAERERYLDLALPRGLQQMMEAINRMPRDQRRAMVDEAMAELNRSRHDPAAREWERQIDPAQVQRIVDEGLRSYLRDATAETKLDLQPLIEQMQHQMRRLDRR